jgi:excinuclease ABC subunit A
MAKTITIKGAKTNNLKNIDVSIPRGHITSIVGVSGAGKNSLAFKTLYAEGYLRYIESISPYIRQFLDKVEKPPVDKIDGLPPAIAFRHKKPAKNPRSTVATTSDIYDYLRIIYSKVSDFTCPRCGEIVVSYTIDEIITDILKKNKGKISVCFEYCGDISFLINRGYYFHLENGIKKKIEVTNKPDTMAVLIDEIEVKPGNKSRLFEALDRSITQNKNQAIIFNGEIQTSYPLLPICTRCQIHYEQPDENLFSFNSPKGACPTCKGFGDIQQLDEDLIFDRELSLTQGAIKPLSTRITQSYKNHLLDKSTARGIDITKPVKNLSDQEIHFLMHGDKNFPGISGFFEFIKKKSYRVQARVFLSRYTTYKVCPDCKGSRLNPIALAYRFQGKNISDLLSLTIEEAYHFFETVGYDEYRSKISPAVFDEIKTRLIYLIESGLYYICLNRQTFTLSRGEFQRINLAFVLGSVISDSLLIIDQPSADLHPFDYEKLIKFLLNLKQNGNTVLVIEHNRNIVKHSDFIIELGPSSGEGGGRIVFQGKKADFFSKNKTLTQQFFNRPPIAKNPGPAPLQFHEFQNASAHNLKNFDFKIPKNRFTIIAGVSGSGKTTLLYDEIYLKHYERSEDILFVDPGISRARANSTVIGFFNIFTPLREFFSQLKESKLHGFLPGHFTFNSPLGRCGECKGKGFVEIEMQFLPTVKIICSECRGIGFKSDILRIKFQDKNIHEILNMSIHEFNESMGNHIPRIKETLVNIQLHGMGYLKLGQRLTTLSLGELQRLKLIKFLTTKKKKTLFLIDEPTFGLHDFDVEMLKNLIDQIIGNQNTVVAADHNFSLIAHADYIIELGPEGGEKGGVLLFQGRMEELLKTESSITGKYIKKILKKS